MPVRIGIVGVGKIARDQHVPALRDDPAFALVACASRNGRLDGIANYPTLEAMLDGSPELDAVSICTPPQFHFEAAKFALLRGRHVLLEKPPCTTLADLAELAGLARRQGRTLFQSWHARFAAAVDSAATWLAPRKILSVRIDWMEDVRAWHPGQSWLWQKDGFGVLDPGINALSILTKILGAAVRVRSARQFVPANREAPIAANVTMVTSGGAPVEAVFDFRRSGEQVWDIMVETDGGRLKLAMGGSRLAIDGRPVDVPPLEEYPALYRHFAGLIARGEQDVDATPFRLVVEALALAERFTVEPFDE